MLRLLTFALATFISGVAFSNDKVTQLDVEANIAVFQTTQEKVHTLSDCIDSQQAQKGHRLLMCR